jgi:hypothetical protein
VKRAAYVAGGVAVIVALFVVLRGRGDDETPRRETAAPRTRTQTAPAVGSRQPRSRPKRVRPRATVVRIQVRGGSVVGGIARPRVQRNARVVVAVSSDTRDEVHVHGYDISREVGPGSPARIAFRATLVGRFEIELEERKLQIAELEVRP